MAMVDDNRDERERQSDEETARRSRTEGDSAAQLPKPGAGSSGDEPRSAGGASRADHVEHVARRQDGEYGEVF